MGNTLGGAVADVVAAAKKLRTLCPTMSDHEAFDRAMRRWPSTSSRRPTATRLAPWATPRPAARAATRVATRGRHKVDDALKEAVRQIVSAAKEIRREGMMDMTSAFTCAMQLWHSTRPGPYLAQSAAGSQALAQPDAPHVTG
jgi:hypothetical protein